MGTQQNKKKLLYICFTMIMVIVVIAGSVYSYFTHKLTDGIVETGNQLLDEYASNNAYATKQELDNALSLMVVAAADFEDESDFNTDKCLKTMRSILWKTPFSHILVADSQGNALSGDGMKQDISHSDYFKRAMLGEDSIYAGNSEIPLENGMLVFSAPIINGGRVIGSIHGFYDKFELSEIVDKQNLNGNSYSIMINQEGDIILDSSNKNRVLGRDENFFKGEEETKFTNDLSIDKIKEKMGNGENFQGTFTKNDGTKRQFYFCSLGVNRWYLVKLVTQSYVDGTAEPAALSASIMTLVLIICCILIAMLVILMIQIYNRRKNQQLKTAYAQAENANAAKSTFLSRMSHEIRTPMNAIVGLTSIAKNHLNEPEAVDGYLDKISASSGILLNIINDVLDMSAIENEKIKIAHTEFNIRDILDSISTVYYAQCKQKGIKFEMSASDISHERLIGDSLRVNQILLNLISNAYKFTPSGGKITVVVSEIIRNDKIYLHIVVKDTGEGMDEDMQKRLFKPFEQENAQTAQKHGGSGLGLSIVKSLVELMHGAIELKSKKGVGTTFFVNIPFDFNPEEITINGNCFENLIALVIDNDKDSMEYTSTVLERIGLKNETAADKIQMEELINKNKNQVSEYSVFFVNWEMPEGIAKYIIGKIREMCGEKPIIIAYAFDISGGDKEKENIGVNSFVSKPLFQSSVFNVLMEFTDGKIGKGKSHAQKTEYDFSGKKILLAEDNLLNTEIAVELLKMVNLECDCAENGKIAAEKFINSEEGTYSAILMDVQMPVMDGYEASKMIRRSKHPQSKDIPMFAMTANAFTEDVAAALAAGMDGHIAKPIDTKSLYETLYNAIFKKES